MALIGCQGRNYTQPTKEDLWAKINLMLKDYTGDEREALEVVLRQKLEEDQGNPPAFDLYKELGDEHFIRKPVSIREFVLSGYYLGKTCDVIFPKLLADLEEIFDESFTEVIFTGAIGTGKTFVSAIGVCYLIYILSCLRDPQKSFKLSPDTVIVIVAFSVTEEAAKDVALKNIIGKVGASPYFERHFKPRITQKKIRFYNDKGVAANVEVMSRATTDRGALGLAIIAALMDESDFMPKRKKKKGADRMGIDSMAKDIYDGIKRRMKSRFGKAGKMFMPCSKTTFDSFIQRRIKQAATDPSIFVRDYSLWDVKPGDIDEETFTVLCGSEQVASKIILDEDELQHVKENLPERATLIQVPMNFLPEFESDLDGAIRDIAGIATASVSPFIQQRHKIAAAIEDTMEHPFSVISLDPSIGGYFEWSKMVQMYDIQRPGYETFSVPRPIVNPDAPRHLHLDLAVSQCSAGLAMGHQAGIIEVSKSGYLDTAPFYWIDFLLEIIPPPGGEIELSMVRQIVYDLMNHGFPIERVTLDQYQSVDSIQQFRSLGIESGRIPTSWDVYKGFKTVLYENRIRFYDYPPLLRELRGLEADWDQRKILKPSFHEGRAGSKDLADAVASLIFSLSQHPPSVSLPIMRGLSSFSSSHTKVIEMPGSLGWAGSAYDQAIGGSNDKRMEGMYQQLGGQARGNAARVPYSG